jgi:hypothetical protein
VPASFPSQSSPCPCWSPRPWAASRLAPASPPLATPRAASSRLHALVAGGALSAVDEEVAVAVPW